MREAPSRVIIDALLAAGAQVRAYDPVAMEEAGRLYGDNGNFTLAHDAYEAAAGADALLIVTEWQEFRSPDFERLRQLLAAPRIFDGRNLYDPALLAQLGFEYYAIGRGAARAGGLKSCQRRQHADSGHPLRRRGHAPVAAVARALSQAAAAAARRAHHAAGHGAAAARARVAAPIVVCNEAHRFLVAEQLRAIDSAAQSIVLEPVGRNTAPAIALAAHAALAGGAGDPMLLVLPADHVIPDVAAFQAAVRLAATAARAGQLVTFGVVPRGPETGYGYIRRGAPRRPVAGASRASSRSPSAPAPRNSSPAASITGTAACSCSAPGATSRSCAGWRRTLPPPASRPLRRRARDLDFTRVAKAEFEHCRSESIDYAVMEKTAMPWWCRSMPAGATWAPGPRCTRPASRTPTAT